MLHLTAAGTEILAQVTASRRVAFHERPAGRPEEDLRRFAGYLLRYNATVDGRAVTASVGEASVEDSPTDASPTDS
ncbi:hypothetical protein GCM10017557_75840 [Streptomyces aurantiacus]|uniref:MarR family transcriptional regulator n=1 Tax=Streptomyces aurantiacus TaxID=47760 RepID=A0A7G1PH12_9ACTN|nr:hypothetical protein GCM10017557_75840 [Streptomyces aurantiacus]